MEKTFDAAKKLREALHLIPEPSGQEVKTRTALMEYLKAGSDLEIHDCGKWFYAAHREGENLPSIAFRADMDAVSGTDGLYHGCGHDGHCSVMASLAAWTSGKSFGKNIFFLFQHAEETGDGGSECLPFFDMEKIDAIFGFHNCPGFPAGSVLMLNDTFACASKGLILAFSGTQSHAAYPENGVNPIFPMSAFFSHWDELTSPDNYRGLVLATPVCFTAGSRSFGVAAGSGEIDLTIRAWYDEDLAKLEVSAVSLASSLCEKSGVSFSCKSQDVFPANVNSPELYDVVKAAAMRAQLDCLTPHEPFRWSEDFGWYGSKTKSFMCGIGGGEDAPGLHTPAYRWNDEVTKSALRLFSEIISA